jgi:transcriptional regulator with XRE-family HTH domain
MVGPTDAEQTRELRRQRSEGRRAAKDLNNPGKRLVWIREKLELTQREICTATGIPTSSYCGREAGIRTDFIEEYLVLAVFFQREWAKKYKNYFPQFQNQEVKKVTVSWLMYGHDELDKNAEMIIEEFRLKIKDMERDHWEKETEMRKQLMMFVEE